MATKNVKATVKGNTLTIEVDLSKDFGPSATGKTLCIATTGGSQSFTDDKPHNDVTINLNVNRKIAKRG